MPSHHYRLHKKSAEFEKRRISEPKKPGTRLAMVSDAIARPLGAGVPYTCVLLDQGGGKVIGSEFRAHELSGNCAVPDASPIYVTPVRGYWGFLFRVRYAYPFKGICMLDESNKTTKYPGTAVMSLSENGPVGGISGNKYLTPTLENRLLLPFLTPIPAGQVIWGGAACIGVYVAPNIVWNLVDTVPRKVTVGYALHLWLVHIPCYAVDGDACTMTGTGNYGAGESPNDTYSKDGTYGGKTKYTANGGTWELSWQSGAGLWSIHKIGETPGTDPDWALVQGEFVGQYGARNGATGYVDVVGEECATWNLMKCDAGPDLFSNGSGYNGGNEWYSDREIDVLDDPWNVARDDAPGLVNPFQTAASEDAPYIYGMMAELIYWDTSCLALGLDFADASADITMDWTKSAVYKYNGF